MELSFWFVLRAGITPLASMPRRREFVLGPCAPAAAGPPAGTPAEPIKRRGDAGAIAAVPPASFLVLLARPAKLGT